MMEFRSIKEDEVEAWLDHCVYVFNKAVYSESYRNYFKNHLINDPWGDLNTIFVAVENSEILSTVRVFHRKIYLLGQEATMGGVGEVSTRPEHQGKGLSTKLLNMAIEKMERLGIQVSQLGSGAHEHYRKLGWRNCIRCWHVSDFAKNQASVSFTLTPVDFDADIPALMAIQAIHSEYSKNFSGTVVRDSMEYWKKWVKCESKNFLTAKDMHGKIIAYISFSINEGQLYIREFCAGNGYADIFDSLVMQIPATINEEVNEVKFPKAISSSLPVKRIDSDDSEMLRLINPFEIGGIKISSTEQLMDMIYEEENPHSGFTFWDIDGF